MKWPIEVVVLSLLAGVGSQAFAQSCEAPLEIIYANQIYQGTSCGSNHLPAENVGTTQMPGDDVVYHVVAGEGQAYAGLLESDSNASLSLFLCRAPCGATSVCIDAATTVGATPAMVSIPSQGGDFYLIVDSTGGCGDYAFWVSGPLGGAGK